MKKLGFGFLRLPRIAGEGSPVDDRLLEQLVDTFLARGGRYFDTAYTYLGGESEAALCRTLVRRHPRSAYEIADKLPGYLVKEPGDCRRFFEESLARCGVERFDVYMLHWLNAENYRIAEQFDEFGFLTQLKREGKVGRIGFSYHDSAELLDRILTAHPEVDCVLLQLNYFDWDSPSIQARACYETVVRHGKSVLVMEPVRGGMLAAPTEDAMAILPPGSPAVTALRFAQSLDGVETVLSGMNAPAQVEENLADLPPMTEAERTACLRAAEVLRRNTAVACTGCGYCLEHCPTGIPIPRCLALYNDYARHPGDDWKIQPVYAALSAQNAAASACVGCRQCEEHCPQKLEISGWMTKIARVFES